MNSTLRLSQPVRVLYYSNSKLDYHGKTDHLEWVGPKSGHLWAYFKFGIIQLNRYISIPNFKYRQVLTGSVCNKFVSLNMKCIEIVLDQ